LKASIPSRCVIGPNLAGDRADPEMRPHRRESCSERDFEKALPQLQGHLVFTGRAMQ